MARHTKTSRANGWQSITFVLIGLLALTNAAWFYKLRTVQAEAASAPAPRAQPVERVIYQTPDGRPAAPPTSIAPAVPRRAAPLAPDETCINGQRFKRQGNGFIQQPNPC